ncbi:MAG: type II-A CRISPR-associated protein Csn2 [Lactobacillales bacterium]|jgi:CRISPR type II-A-associated protein Csn2|nr:type II-A CRISPR-associated protein Csn2 [Lactobacillales bacterium]
MIELAIYSIDYLFEIEKDQATTLVIENTALFARVIESLWQVENGEEGSEQLSFFDSKNKRLNMAKSSIVITDPLRFDFHSKVVVSAIHKELVKIYQDYPELLRKLEEFYFLFYSLLEKNLNEQINLDLSINPKLDLFSLFKFMDIKLEENGGKTIFERLLSLIEVIKELNMKELLILVEVQNYLTDEQLAELLNEISLRKIQVLFIESRQRPGKFDSKNYLIDNDFEVFES